MDEIFNEITAIIARHDYSAITDAPKMAADVQPLLQQLAKCYGPDSQPLRQAADQLGKALLRIAITQANKISNAFVDDVRSHGRGGEFANVAISHLKAPLEIFDYVSSLPLSDEFRAERLLPQRNRLDGMISSLMAFDAKDQDIKHSRTPLNAKAQTGTDSQQIAPKLHHRRSVRTLLRWVAAMVILVSVSAFGAYVYWQRCQIDDFSSNFSEDAVMQYMLDHGSGIYGKKALEIYIVKMDSMLTDASFQPHPSQYPPLVRMDNFARDRRLDSDLSSVIDAFVREYTDSLYRMAAEINTLDAWEAFQQLAPSRYYADSSARLDSLDREAWAAEPTAWYAALRSDTKDAYQRYLSEYPQGANVRRAEGRIIDIEVGSYRNRGKASMERIDSIAPSAGDKSQIHIFNNTAYPMEFLFSGPSSKRMAVPSEGMNSVALDNGQYRVLVIVEGRGGERFSFVQTFYGGIYSTAININTSES